MSADRAKAEEYVADPKLDDTRPRRAEVREAHLAGRESMQEEIDNLKAEIERLRRDRQDALSVTSVDGLLASEWVARTGAAERVVRSRDAEIAVLRKCAERDAAEIEALREAVRRTYHLQSDGSITTTYSVGCFEELAELSGIENEVLRALEEKP